MIHICPTHGSFTDDQNTAPQCPTCNYERMNAKPAEYLTRIVPSCPTCAALRAGRDALARKCNSLEDDREYNAGLVKERDARIALLEKVAEAARKCVHGDYCSDEMCVCGYDKVERALFLYDAALSELK